MAFIRFFDTAMVEALSGENQEIYQKLLAEIRNGSVFPAVRKDNLDFYFAGGLLFKLENGKFSRDKNYEKNHNQGTEGMEYYEKCKKQNENKFVSVFGKPSERHVLWRLSSMTYIPNNSKVVVIDVEININEDNKNKCDMLLLNTETAQIMFVEGKLYQDRRMRGTAATLPPVVVQVCGYTQTIETHQKTIEEQYTRHIEIVNALFDKKFPTKVSLVLPAKLIVYSHAEENPVRAKSTKIINEKIGTNNIMWNFENNFTGISPSLEEIWDALI